MDMPLLQDFSTFDRATVHDFWLVPSTCFDGKQLQQDMALHLSSSETTTKARSTNAYQLVDIRPLTELRKELNQSHSTRKSIPLFRWQGCISTGMFDIQINGGGGALFNNTPTVAGLRTIANAHRASGTTAFLPTVITDSDAVMSAATDAVIATHGQLGIEGIHFEGPHINPQKRGTHDAHLIRTGDLTHSAIVRLTQKLRQHDIPVLITLAPECLAAGSITQLVKMGAVVSIGHTAASAAQIQSALDEGAQCFTHLFNAMPPMTSRDPSVVGVALTSEAWCSLIADGHHVSDAMLQIAIRSRQIEDRMILVSDAMASWNGPDHFELYGQTIHVQEGKLINAEGALAGAHIDLAHSVWRAITVLKIAPEQALRMVTHNPSQLMKLHSQARLRIGQVNDLVLWDNSWKVQQVWAKNSLP